MPSVRDAYDEAAELYASLFLDELDRDDDALRWLARFAELAAGRCGPVADVGCGPGSVVAHLHELGVAVVGYDISPGQIEQARKAFPGLGFEIGDLGAIDVPDASLGGIVSRYSIIHLVPDQLEGVFGEWRRALEPGAPVLMSFFGSLSADAHGTPFDHKVTTAYELFPDIVGQHLRTAGFDAVETAALPPAKGGRPFSRATVIGLALG